MRFIAPIALLFTALFVHGPSQARADWDLNIVITNRSSFSSSQIAILDQAIIDAEHLWESQITGTHGGAVDTFTVQLTGANLGGSLGNANSTGNTTSGPFTLSTGGSMRIDFNGIDQFSNFMGVNVIDELLAHEIGHAMGIGTLWIANGVYVNNSGQYTGEHGLRAYRRDFDSSATFIPVELNGGAGTRNAHWDQLMRSAGEAGTFDPNNPFNLDPRIGITDNLGRDLSLELMTGALDPDYGEPFLAPFTVQSLRDIGFLVVPEPTSLACLLISVALCASRRRRI
ncbi:MAG: PEP-CTERM sorting domain-containing protein [Lacipirellulaceae bacterium]